MTQWKLKEKIENEVTTISGVAPLVSKLLAARGVADEKSQAAFLYPNYERDLLDPFLFADMERAVERVAQAKDKDELIAIFGDYDADGITASLVLKETFRELGVRTIVYIPDKKKEGYGMNVPAIKELKRQGATLIVTVDCGITSRQEVEEARALGVDVIITDHHNVPSEIPKALAVINPKVVDSGYPFKDLAGVGVAFKLSQAIFQRLLPKKAEQLKWFLDLVAIGTVADCVPLHGENRTIVRYGLVVLGKTRRAGLRELFAVGKIQINENMPPTAWNISFQIAPRINAAGRMEHANMAYFLLDEVDPVHCRNLALELEGKNAERQKITKQIVDEVRMVAQNAYKDKKYIIAIGEHYPVGIIGLAAGKIAQEFNRPTLILQKGEMESRGSGRSIPQMNLMEALNECQELLVKFGGHSQAAGMEVANENLPAFYERFGAAAERLLEGKSIESVLSIDMEAKTEEVDFELMNALKLMEPFGEGNPEPLFLMKDMLVHEVRRVGSSEKHLKLYVRGKSGSPKIFEAIGFNLVTRFENIKAGDTLDMAFTLSEETWNGSKKLVMKIVDLAFQG